MDYFYKILTAVHAIEAFLLIVYMLSCLFRKHKLTFYQWHQLVQMVALNCLEVSYNLTYDEDTLYEDCGYKTKMFFGATNFLFFTISFLLATTLYWSVSRLHEFVSRGTLPTRKQEFRHTAYMVGIWATCVLVWLMYMLMNTLYTNKG